jgi:hypothetical protein
MAVGFGLSVAAHVGHGAVRGKNATLFCLRWSHNRSAISDPPGRIRIAAYGASSSILAAGVALDL